MKKKKIKNCIYFIAFIILITVILRGKYIFHEDYIKIELLDNEVSQSIEQQVGNYINEGICVDGDIYIFQNYYRDEDYTGPKCDAIYKVSPDGTCNIFYQFQDGVSDPYIYYFEGYFYVRCFNDNSYILRISKDGKNSEIIYETEENFMFGIRDGILILSDEEKIYYMDLNKETDFSKMKMIKNEMLFYECNHLFFCEWIYNDKYMYTHTIREIGQESEYAGKSRRQYYKGDLYMLQVDKNIICSLIRHTPHGGKEEVVATGVIAFNIYKDRIYYVKYEDGINRLNCMDIDTGDNEELAVFYYEDTLFCPRIYVSDDTIVCDVANKDKVRKIERRFIFDKNGRLLNKISFRE